MPREATRGAVAGSVVNPDPLHAMASASPHKARASAECGLVWLVVIGWASRMAVERARLPAIIWVSGCRARRPARATASTPPAHRPSTYRQ